MKKLRQQAYTPWYQPDYERALRPAELVSDFSRRHLTRIWQGIPSIQQTPGGTLFAVWYSGGHGEGMDNFVMLSRKRPGCDWECPFLVIESVEGIRTYDPNVWLDPNGHLHLFWAQAHMFMDGRDGVWESVCDQPDADAPMFSAPRRLCDGLMLNKPTVLSDGRWLYTIARCRMKRFHNIPVCTVLADIDDEKRNAQVFFSADQGKTLQYLGEAVFHNSDFYEHMLYERRDGSLRMLARCAPELAESISTDGGRTWSPEAPSGIPNPSSRFFVRRMPSGRLLMINHDTGASRSRLCAFLSDDDGATWSYKLMLDERDSVSYPDAAVLPDGRVQIIYDRDRYNKLEILMASVTEEDILRGELTDSASFLHRIIDNAGVIDEA